jgi:hypothetical protein
MKRKAPPTALMENLPGRGVVAEDESVYGHHRVRSDDELGIVAKLDLSLADRPGGYMVAGIDRPLGYQNLPARPSVSDPLLHDRDHQPARIADTGAGRNAEPIAIAR